MGGLSISIYLSTMLGNHVVRFSGWHWAQNFVFNCSLSITNPNSLIPNPAFSGAEFFLSCPLVEIIHISVKYEKLRPACKERSHNAVTWAPRRRGKGKLLLSPSFERLTKSFLYWQWQLHSCCNHMIKAHKMHIEASWIYPPCGCQIQTEWKCT